MSTLFFLYIYSHVIDFLSLYCCVMDIITLCFRGVAQSKCIRVQACEDQQRCIKQYYIL